MSPSRLSHVLRGHFGLSPEAAESIALRLGMSRTEKSTFCDLVQSQHARSAIKRASAKKRLQKRVITTQTISADAFKVICDWYHFAILELSRTTAGLQDAKSVSRRLGISVFEAEQALERLTRLGMLKSKNGTLVATDSYFANPEGVPSHGIKTFHRQILEKALKSLFLDPVDEREFSNLIFAVDPADLPKLRDRIREFVGQVDREFSVSPKKSGVYNLSIQLFPLLIKERN